ncbi:hypothetical protein [Acidovorax sp. Root219]|uniref:hypothetical protein n=1 Tax=Acidovorax sp. Root219 TaxID=1736493 RepID=UPI00070FCFE0|nr:hypothetical protein [Acidovorax sp. Root219]KRC33455.1 hypothetical protein ASE28_09705 [Acidovorax sp. Root219]
MLHNLSCTASFLVLAAGLLGSGAAWAQLASDSTAAQRAQEACRSEVSKFEEAIGFIRRSQGNQAAADLKEKLLPARLESEILFKEGYCGLARHIREKKLG